MKKISLFILVVLLSAVSAYAGPSVNTGGSGSASIDWSGTTEARLSGVTDSVQSQLNIISGTSGGAAETDAIALAALTAATNAFSSGGTDFVKSGVTPAYVNTLTSDAQAQLDAKGDIFSVLDDTSGAVSVLIQSGTSLTSGATQPSVAGHSVFLTNSGVATTINTFADGTDGQIIFVIAMDANTTFDFTSSDLEGSSADYTAVNGETLLFIYSSLDSKWHYLGFPKTLSSVTVGGGTPLRVAYWDASGNLASSDMIVSGTTDTLNLDASGVTLILDYATAPIMDTSGTIAIDSTANQLVAAVSVASSVTPVVLGGVTEFMSIVVSGVTDADDLIIASMPYGIIIKEVTANLTEAGSNHLGTTATINLQECGGSTPGTCADLRSSDWVLSGATSATLYSPQSDFGDSEIARNNLLKLDVASGVTSGNLTVTVKYWIKRE